MTVSVLVGHLARLPRSSLPLSSFPFCGGFGLPGGPARSLGLIFLHVTAPRAGSPELKPLAKSLACAMELDDPYLIVGYGCRVTALLVAVRQPQSWRSNSGGCWGGGCRCPYDDRCVRCFCHGQCRLREHLPPAVPPLPAKTTARTTDVAVIDNVAAGAAATADAATANRARLAATRNIAMVAAGCATAYETVGHPAPGSVMACRASVETIAMATEASGVRPATPESRIQVTVHSVPMG